MEVRHGWYFNSHTLIKSLLLITSIIFGVLITNANTLAVDWDYDTCISKSGGRGGIPSVQWACNNVTEGVNTCTAWIGSSTDSSSLKVYAESLSGTINIAYWGMCTDEEDTTSALWVDNDNDSIGDSENLTRGTWASPKSLNTTLDIGKFVDGVTPTQTSEGAVYTRNVEVGRCNGDNPDSCSTQNQDISVIMPGDKFRARATSTESADDHSSTTSGYTDQEVKGSDNKITIPCSNNGCDANFTFDIERTTFGSENASWVIQKRSTTKNATGNWDWFNTTIFGTAPGSSGNQEQNVSSFNLTLDPGTTTCYRIAFTPDSTSGNTQTVATCVEALPVTFEGYSKVYLTNNTSTKASTGWKNSGNLNNATNTAWLELTDCNDGCNITFEHGIKRTQGLDTSTSTYDVASIGANSDTFPANSPASHTITIKTGQAYCRTLTFDRKIAYSTTTGNVAATRTPTRACAYAIGTYSSSIDIKAKKSTSSTWLEAPSTTPIYAKPTDTINLQGNYTPKYQPTYSYKPYAVKIDSTSITNNGANTIQNVFNSNINPHWNNAFSIKLNGNNASFSELAQTNAIGNNNNYSSDRNYTVGILDPGNTITATALTNNINSTKTTPKQVGFTYTIGDGFTATVNKDQISDNAYIVVPYNFNNSTCVKSKTTSENDANGCIKSDVERIAYAGETETIDYLLKVNPRNNPTVGDTYATIVKDAKWKLRICINENDNCTETSEQTSNLNTDGLLGGSIEPQQEPINIPDVAAGTRVCIYSAIYPTSVASDTDLNSYGNNTWGYSAPSCFKIAKKPSLQIIGGNIYSRGPINTETSVKKHLSGVNDPYNPKATHYDNHVFGSWGELGLIASDKVIGLSSGATLNYTNGSSETSICNRSPLTFANFPCLSTQSVGQIGNSIAAKSIQEDNDAISSKYLYGGEPTVTEGTVNLANEEGKMRDDSVYYYYATHDLIVPASTIDKGHIKIVHSTGNVTITGNLEYADGYTSFDDIPKLLIYARNITIDCSVSRVDAVLAAEERVITCNNFDNDYDNIANKVKSHINDAVNSHPLTINGAIISRQLIPNRTYGAATGTNSSIPAEIINFDPTLYRWGGDRMEGQSVNTNLNVTYQHEQAPRY